jgi:uncharacterized protein (TIGR02996 family)
VITSPDETAFLTALAANPYDQLARLVYADWLADHDRYADEGRQRALAEGYEALREGGYKPREGGPTLHVGKHYPYEWWAADRRHKRERVACYDIPEGWFALIDGGTRTRSARRCIRSTSPPSRTPWTPRPWRSASCRPTAVRNYCPPKRQLRMADEPRNPITSGLQ